MGWGVTVKTDKSPPSSLGLRTIPDSTRPTGAHIAGRTKLMLPNVANGSARRCSARARATGERCKKLAVGSCRTCKSHGGHKQVKRGEGHYNFRGAGQTLPERQERHEMAVFFHKTEDLMFALGMMAPGSTRTRGRKPIAKN